MNDMVSSIGKDLVSSRDPSAIACSRRNKSLSTLLEHS